MAHIFWIDSQVNKEIIKKNDYYNLTNFVKYSLLTQLTRIIHVISKGVVIANLLNQVQYQTKLLHFPLDLA